MKTNRLPLSVLAVVILLLVSLSAMAFTGPFYPIPEYYVDPTGSGFNTWGGPEIGEMPSCSLEEEETLGRYLHTYGWTLEEGYEVKPLPSPEDMYPQISEALEAFKPDGYKFDLGDGVYWGRLYDLLIPGYVDRMTVYVFVYVENGSVTGAVLECNLHQGLTLGQEESSFQEFYPIDTPSETIQKDAAAYLSQYGKKPFNESAALDFPGGHRVSEEQQAEFAALFSWKKPHYDFLYSEYTRPITLLWSDEHERAIAKTVYSTVYATSGIALTEAEASSLLFNCYYSESVYACGDNYYAVDFMVRWHKGYPDPKNPALGEFDLPSAWLTWLVVKPLVKNEDGTLDRFYYASDTPQGIIAYDMKTYFNETR